MKFEVYCQHEDYSKTLNIYIFMVNPNGGRSIVTSLDRMEVAEYKEGDPIKPTFSLCGKVTDPFLQAMANALKEIGIKPDGDPVLENEMAAVKYHLEDMRRLVFRDKN